LRTDVLFIRAQSPIRADGAPSAQVLLPLLDLFCYVHQRRCSTIARFARQPYLLYG
jgi:hypothetical protein